MWLLPSQVLSVKLADLGAARNVKSESDYTLVPVTTLRQGTAGHVRANCAGVRFRNGRCQFLEFDPSVDANPHRYIATTQHMPAKWMPLEALRQAKFSHKSDVFAFAVMLWEICSYGKPPWGAFGIADIADALKSGERLQGQPGAPVKMRDLCLRCWSTEPRSRPSFAQINDELQILPAIVKHTQRELANGGNAPSATSATNAQGATGAVGAVGAEQNLDSLIDDYSTFRDTRFGQGDSDSCEPERAASTGDASYAYEPERNGSSWVANLGSAKDQSAAAADVGDGIIVNGMVTPGLQSPTDVLLHHSVDTDSATLMVPFEGAPTRASGVGLGPALGISRGVWTAALRREDDTTPFGLALRVAAGCGFQGDGVGIPHVVVHAVQPGGIADRAGVTESSRIAAINGVSCTGAASLLPNIAAQALAHATNAMELELAPPL